MKTYIIMNPNAGRTRSVWQKVEPNLTHWLTDYELITTQHPREIAAHLQHMPQTAPLRIISLGGDGTNNHILKAMMIHRQTYPQFSVVFGTIPAGTGRDFVRSTAIPLDPIQAAEYLFTKAVPCAMDVGMIQINDESHHYMNISNIAIANDVVRRVERSPKRPWSFFVAIVQSLLAFQPKAVRIELDQSAWFEGEIYVAAIANGRYTGQGLHIAPHASLDDGLFDVIVGEKMPAHQLLKVVPLIYSGQHITHPHVKEGRAQQVTITSLTGQAIGLDIDGELSDGAERLSYQMIPAALTILL